MSRNIETIDSSLSQDPACVSLLPKAEADERYNNNMFGQFKGFTITPIHSNQSKLAEPTKPAPPPPGWIPTVAIKTNVVKPSVQKCNVPQKSNLSSSSEPSSVAPALPPLNPGSTARPLISSPVLAATTCTSVELVTKVPTRPAPDVPTRPAPPPPITSAPSAKPQRPNSTPLTNVILPEPERKPDKGSTLNRIASMLRPGSSIMRSNSQSSQRDDKNTNSLPRSQHHKANKVIDKEILRNLEISNPIPQTQIEITTPVIPVISVAEVERKNVVLRAQSMRDSKITRPLVHTFGSMRQTTPAKRPTSIPASTRPTSPPPGPPSIAQTERAAESAIKIPGLPGYQNPPVKTVPKPLENTYDDCMNLIAESSLTKITEESPTNDNIYAVIEEPVPEKNRKNAELEITAADNEYKLPKRIDTMSGGPNSLESMGLLSEIVSEISNRNFDSIYSTSTLTRKKKENNREDATKNLENIGSNNSLGGYMNSSHYKIPGGIYSNSASGKFNSSSSTTSSGYLHPSVINVPQMERKEANKSISDANDNLKPVDKSNVNTLASNNPNINDELSKELGMKPPENHPIGYKPFASTKTRPSHLIHIKKDDQAESKIPAKPPFNRTKTPPNIARSPTCKDTPESGVKLARQSSDNTLKSLKSSKTSDASSTTAKQSSDASPTARQTQLNASESSSDLDKEESHTAVSVKNVPCSPKDSLGKFNSPDLVSSCSNSNQGGTKSPDVVGSNPKFSLPLKTVQKTPTLPRGGQKTPTTPLKPLNVTSKAASFSERKKSPTGSASVPAKSLSPTAKEANNGGAKPSHLTPKVVSAKAEPKTGDGGVATRTNPLQRVASGKSNVASLQQKFEANKSNSGVARTMPSANGKKLVARMTEVGGSGARK